MSYPLATPARVAERTHSLASSLKSALFGLTAKLFSGNPEFTTVETDVYLPNCVEDVWSSMLTYEEVPGNPPLLVRLLLPRPVKTHGDKTVVGNELPCHYEGGGMIKRITSVEAPNLLAFDVLDQQLGIESCLRAVGGSYAITREGSGSRIRLVTNYEAKLHPRALWHPLEDYLAHAFHRHILAGMAARLPRAERSRAHYAG